MKKVGIVTFHTADNFGAVLQAYALMETINKYNEVDAEIINFTPIEIGNDYSLYFNLKYTMAEKGLKGTAKELIRRIVYYNKYKETNKNFSEFRNQHLKISAKSYRTGRELMEARPPYDYYITGSDQVWNPDFFMKIGGSYFLDFTIEKSVKISYAASIAKQVEEDYVKYYKQYLKDFDHISVRESSSRDFVAQASGKEVYVTLDPTLLLTKTEWNQIATNKENHPKYILVYDLIKDPLTVAVANKVANEYQCGIISYSNGKGYDRWYGSFSTSNPTDFLGLFQHAEFVVTSSYHGTVFAVNYNKPFYTIPHPTRGKRMIDLLNDLGLNSRIICDVNQMDLSDNKLDETGYIDKLNHLKGKSIRFLESALGIMNE